MSKRERKRKPLPEQEPELEASTSSEEQEPKSNRRFLFILFYIAVFAFAIYAAITLIGLHSQIAEKRAELEEIQGEITVQEIKNDEIGKMYNYTDDEFADYVERIARDDLDFVKSGERVFVNVSGD
ncbi:MAG: septum formation initiator family protein [Ruminococcus sp.]|nr:septum formation initiator family protein [Ruminococcus sp.]